MKKYSIILRIAALLILTAVSLSSCGIIIINKPDDGVYTETESETEPVITEETVTSETSVETASPETTSALKPYEATDYKSIALKYLNALTNRDFGGVGISMMTTDKQTFVPTDTTNLVYNTRIERNALVEQKYNTIFMSSEVDVNTMYEQTRAAVLSGDYYADLIAIPMNNVGIFYSGGLLMNLNSLPFTDFTAPYYDTAAMKQLTAGYEVFGTLGEFNKNIDYDYAIYFNKNMIAELGLESPYNLVYKDEWTWDKFREYTLATSKIYSLYGFGSSLSIEGFIDMSIASTGQNYMDTGAKKIPDPTYYNDKIVKIINILKNILRGDGTVYDGKYSSDGALSQFYDGNMLFYADRTYVMSWFEDMEDNWGIVPLPKLNSSQSGYVTYSTQSLPIVCVPKGNSNVDNTGLFLQASNAASYGYLNDVYYTVLMNTIIRDSDSLNMLDYIIGRDGKGSLYCDFAMMFGPAYSYVADITYTAVRNSVTKDYSLDTVFKNYYSSTLTRLRSLFEMLNNN